MVLDSGPIMCHIRYSTTTLKETSMGCCDLCSCDLHVSHECLFTTIELVTNRRFWKKRLSVSSWKESIRAIAPSEQKRFMLFMDLVHRACASSTPWMLCEDCSRTFPNLEQARVAAEKVRQRGSLYGKYAENQALCTVEDVKNNLVVRVIDAEGHSNAMNLATSAYENHYGITLDNNATAPQEPSSYVASEEAAQADTDQVPKNSLKDSCRSVAYNGTSDETLDWSSITPCQECDAGNPCNAIRCIRCGVSLPKVITPQPERLLTRAEAANIFSKGHLNLGFSDFAYRTTWLGWVWKLFCALCLTALAILLLLAAIVFVLDNALASIGIVVAGLVLVLGIHHLLENADIREARRDEKSAKREERAKIRAQAKVRREGARISDLIKGRADSQVAIEDILPSVLTSNHEAVAEAISLTDSMQDTDKSRLFKNLGTDAVSNILNCFTETEQITLLYHMELEQQVDVLIRFPLPRRRRLERGLHVMKEEKTEKSLD